MKAESSHEGRLFEVIAHWLEGDEARRASREELLSLHPELAGELRDFFERHDEITQAASLLADDSGGEPIDRSLIDQPTLAPKGDLTDPLDAPFLGRSAFAAHLAGDEETLRLFGDYELIRELARGGMGVVYLARQRKLNRIVALKMILAGQLASSEDVRRFYAEAEAAATLEHPGIVPIHDVGQIEGQHYFSMGYVEGKSLADRLAAGPLDPFAAAELVRKIALALHFAHGRGVIHRDLKPANILLDAGGEPKVTDFGLAKLASGDGGLTVSGQILGTPGYMPPEQASGRGREVGPLSDVYGLGAILYAALTGRPPFTSENPIDTLLQVLESEPTLPTKLNRRATRNLELICLRCLEKEPARRYASAQALADDLQRYLKGEPIEARAATIWPRVRRWARREPALASHWAAIAVTAIVVQIVFFFYGSDTAYHLRNMAALGAWAAISYGLQRLMNVDRYAHVARFTWALADTVLTTLLIAWADPPRGPLLVGYPLLIAASGLFFRVRLVTAMTILAILAYGVLISLRPEERNPIYYSIIYGVALAVVGFLIGYQTHRMRALSQYYEHKTEP